MVTDQYSHILDDDRKNNAALFEKAFYAGKGADAPEAEPSVETVDSKVGETVSATPEGTELLLKLLQNPETAALLTALAKTIK